MGVGKTWRLTPWVVKLVVVLLFAVGAVVLLAGFFWVDQGWWGTHSFALNIATALVGFCFGAPIAVIGLATINSSQQRNAEVAKVDELTERTWVQFHDAFRTYVNEDDRLPKATTFAEEACRRICEVRAALYRYGTLGLRDRCTIVPGDPDTVHLHTPQPETFATFVRSVDDLTYWFEAELRQVPRATRGFTNRSDSWNALCAQWEFIDTHLRARRAEVGGTWFNSDLDGYFRSVFDRSQDWISAIGFLLQDEQRADRGTLRGEIDALRAMTAMGEQTFFMAYLSQSREPNGDRHLASSILPDKIIETSGVLSGMMQTFGAINPRTLTANPGGCGPF